MILLKILSQITEPLNVQNFQLCSEVLASTSNVLGGVELYT